MSTTKEKAIQLLYEAYFPIRTTQFPARFLHIPNILLKFTIKYIQSDSSW